jgi:hypothetical protein
MAKKQHKLDKRPASPKPAFAMADPNDDAAAFGWSLGKLRYRGKPDEEHSGEFWPGPHVFAVPTPIEVRQVYGHEIEFVNPAFVQLLLEADPTVRAAADKVKAAGYSPAALKKFGKTIATVFREKILPEIEQRFESVADMVAEFYAARLAYIDKFGNDQE